MEFQHELIIPNEGLPFKVFLFEGGNGNYVREKHWHTSIEIFAVLEGHLEFFMNKEEYPLKAGEQMIINSNEIHSIRAVEKNKTVVLQIPLKQFENYFTAQRFIRFRSQDEAADVKLASLIKKLYKVYTARDVGYEFRTMSLFYEIMYMLVKNYRLTEVHEKEIRHSRRLDAILRYRMRIHRDGRDNPCLPIPTYARTQGSDRRNDNPLSGNRPGQNQSPDPCFPNRLPGIIAL